MLFKAQGGKKMRLLSGDLWSSHGETSIVVLLRHTRCKFSSSTAQAKSSTSSAQEKGQKLQCAIDLA